MIHSKDLRAEVSASRQHGLDLVRAAAIIFVMLYHANNMMLIARGGSSLIAFGWMDVDLFFVLSGYLIGGQLLKQCTNGSRPDYFRFFTRRALRTIPAFAAVLTVYLLFPALRETPNLQPLWQYCTFTMNLVPDSRPGAFNQVWSLCVEEHFYLLFPLGLVILSKKPSVRTTSAVLFGLIAAGIVVRAFLWLALVAKSPFDPGSVSNWQTYVTLIYRPTWSRLDGLLAGVALAALKTFRPLLWARFVSRPNLILAGGVAGIGLAISLFSSSLSPVVSAAFGFPLLSASGALIVAAASTGCGAIGKIRVPGGQALATGAYSLYLTHKLAFHATQVWIAPALGVSEAGALALALIAAILLATILYWTVERPFLMLRERLEQRGAARRGRNIGQNTLTDLIPIFPISARSRVLEQNPA
ncbi:MAG TPA: acyltransferase [Sphingomicrobium sp.]|nr:acyltransferase [Sphingomicrobium sp.]